jgi:ribosomal protein S18 acetylase RimI-like enzyme
LVDVRRGTADDVGVAEEVWRLSVTARDAHPPSDEVVRIVHDVLRAPDTALFVADDRGAIVGMACTRPGRDEDDRPVPGLCHLQMIFVLPERAGSGIGGRLLDLVLDQARSDGFDHIQLWVIEDNEPAARLYAARGFTHSGRVVEENGANIGLWSRRLDG